jgi:hypothetical protein
VSRRAQPGAQRPVRAARGAVAARETRAAPAVLPWRSHALVRLVTGLTVAGPAVAGLTSSVPPPSGRDGTRARRPGPAPQYAAALSSVSGVPT